jgi:hypothetical protein
MFYRDFMQKYRPVYSPDEPASAGGATEAAATEAGASGQAASAGEAGPSAEPVAAAAGAGEAAPAAQGADTAAPAAGAEAPKAEPSLLEAAETSKATEPAKAEGDKKDEPAPAEAAKPEGDKSDGKDVKDPKAEDKPKAEDDKSAAAETDPAKKDATAESQPPAPIKYDAFKVPDGIKLDDERIGKFSEIAGAAQVPQDVAQSLVDLHISEMQRFADETKRAVEQNQIDVWNRLNDTWKTDTRNDPQIGGARLETALSRGKALMEEYGGTPEQVRELLAHTTHNGMGNFPGFLRFLDNIAEALNVYEDHVVGNNAGPPKPQRSPGNRGWYDKSNMGGGTPAA